MSQNLLGERLKNAKRELTALKTAHRRGLGLLKVYKEEYTVTAPSTEAYWLTIDLEIKGAIYPFVQLYAKTNDSGSTVARGAEFEYKDGGKTAEFRVVCWDDKLNYDLVVYSTSPIESMKVEWSLI